jgi:hypothetical protein
MEISQHGEVLFSSTPIMFRRIHKLCPNTLTLEYSHSDLVVRLSNENDVLIEVIQGMLANGLYELKMVGHSFPLQFSQSTPECINWCKKLIFTCFPDLPVCDMFAGSVLVPSAN